jgi:large subunit ribosomal protein L3
MSGEVNYWPTIEGDPRLLGFAGYKAGMTHLYYVEDKRRSPEYGQEIKTAATIIEAPPLLILGIRAYNKTNKGLLAFTEVWMDDIPSYIFRGINSFESNSKEGLENLELYLDEINEMRVIVATQPSEISIAKKNPDIMEIPISGGSVRDSFEYAKTIIGTQINVSEIFKDGETVDVIGVTKGKGFQGPVKRWGVRILQHKSRKTKRGVASIGPWVPRRVMPQVPRAGQMGFHNRTEYNKKILMLDNDGEKVTPKGGFKRYGQVKGDYILLKGSVMGPCKRLIKLRKSVRTLDIPEEPPQITYINN